MKIEIPKGWRYPVHDINWTKRSIDEFKIIIDKSGAWHFLERV